MKKLQNTLDSVLDYKKTPLWNESLPIKDRLDYIVQELTMEEKIQCLTVRAPKIERLGIQSFMIGGEAAHGVEARHDQAFNKGVPVKTTVFTQPIGMSGTWDTDLIEKAGIVTGTEARVIYQKEGTIGLSRWAPTVDMERDPRWGRTEEGYGEDPFLVGKMASAYIQGMQGRDNHYIRCGATLKHFYANNEEYERAYSSSSLDSRNKHEYYYEPFRRAIMDAKAESVMTSYNEINGIPAIVNHEVQEVLKDQWGLRGHVVCDMGDMVQTVTKHKYFDTDAKTLAAGLKAGIDSFNDPEEVVIAAAKEALELGFITEEDVNQAIRNTFGTKLRLGIYDAGNSCPYSNIGSDRLNCQEHQEISLEVARKAMVLLKNEAQLLPINPSTTENIAVVGPLADEWFKDWYTGLPVKAVTPFQGIKKEFPSAQLTLSDGSDRIRIKVNHEYLAVNQDGTFYFSDERGAEIFEHTDWGDNKHTFRTGSSRKYLSADTEKGSVIADQDEVFSWFVQEAFSLYPITPVSGNGERQYKITCWNQKPLYVDENGAISISTDISNHISNGLNTKTDTGIDTDRESDTKMIFCFEIIIDGIQQAVEYARNADKIIAVLGCHPIISGKEETDRSDIILPPAQRNLIQSIRMVNPNLVMVLISNYPYAINWEQENIPSILTTASGSQDLGTAIAEAVSGAYSPAGRLNMTWYLSSSQLPPMRDYDIIRGKRTYQYFDGPVLYPFGYGLSYTEFCYAGLQVNKDPDQIVVTLKVKNMGRYDSDEVVQLYMRQLSSRTVRPIKQLKGFKRLFIKSQEEQTITFTVPYKELEYYDVVSGYMVLEDSDYAIQVGTSSQDIRQETIIHVNGMVIPPRAMDNVIPCDHYDSYENMFLHRGYDGKPCMLPKYEESVSEYKGIVIYNHMKLNYVPEKIIIDMKAMEAGNITIWFGEAIIGNKNLDVMEQFEKIEIPLDGKDLETGAVDSLKLEIRGRLGIVEFTLG